MFHKCDGKLLRCRTPNIPFLPPHCPARQWCSDIPCSMELCRAPSQPSPSRDAADPRAPKWTKCCTVSMRHSSFTCLIAVLPIRALHTLKAAGGLPFNDSLPGPCQAVSAAVGEGYLEDREHKVTGCSCRKSHSPFDLHKRVVGCKDRCSRLQAHFR